MAEQAPTQVGGKPPQRATPGARLGRELSSYRLEQRGIENGLVLTVVNLATVDHLADIEAVLEQVGERAHAKGAPGDGAADRYPPRAVPNRPLVELLRKRAEADGR